MEQSLFLKLRNEIEKRVNIVFLTKPMGFGWAKDRHFRATILSADKKCNIVLKRCWSKESFKIEEYAYNRIFNKLTNFIPKLYYSIELSGDYWLLIEDVGIECLDKNKYSDRLIMLKILGHLHAFGKKYIENNDTTNLVKFHCNNEYEDKLNLLRKALQESNLNIDSWLIDFFEKSWDTIINRDYTILHGDTDHSNFIKNEDNFYIIDFERCKIGPICLDFSKFVDNLQSKNELESYLIEYNKYSNSDTSLDELIRDATLGEIYDNFHWLCYDIKNYFQPSYKEYVFDNDEFTKKLNKLKMLRNKYL